MTRIHVLRTPSYGRREKKPKLCPGCARELPLNPQTLCAECADELEEARRLKPQLVTLRKRESRTFFMGERAFVPSSARYISTPHDEPLAESGDAVAVRFAEAMTDFLAAVGGHDKIARDPSGSDLLFPDASGGAMRYLNYRRDSWANSVYAVVMPGPAVDALRTIYAATNALIEQARLDGLEEGRDLLGQLAGGTVTVERFEAHADELKRERQRLDELAARMSENRRQEKKKPRRRA